MFAVAAGSIVLWAAAAITAVISGHPVPKINLGTGVRALWQDRGNPSAAWGQPVGPTWLYWTSTASVLAVLVAALAGGWWVWARNKTSRNQDPRRLHGLASRAEVAEVAGAKAVIPRAASVIGSGVPVLWTTTRTSRTPCHGKYVAIQLLEGAELIDATQKTCRRIP